MNNPTALLISLIFIFNLSPVTKIFAEELPAGIRTTRLSDSKTRIASWSDGNGNHYGIDLGDGDWQVTDNVSYNIKLRFSEFDPVQGIPTIPKALELAEEKIQDATESVYIVQFVTQPLQSYRDDIKELGGTIHKYLPQYSYLVRMSPDTKAALEKQNYVRWIGLFQPVFKIDETLLPNWLPNAKDFSLRFNIMVHQRGPEQKKMVATQIKALGGTVDALIDDGFILEATLNRAQVESIAALPEVAWMDLWSEREVDMDLAREIGGANYVETVAGYTGQGVRGEVMDGNLFDSHVDFQNIPPIFHGPRVGSDDHGTGTYGIVFGDGTGDPAAVGMLPMAQGIFADFGQLENRYTHTAELNNAPFFAVFQSNSWGNNQTTSYNSLSAEMDDIIFINDILITQSQSNLGNQFSRPQAWAKNIVSVGGINHVNTLTTNDDFWGGASVGPAADGRIKPDLSHFYDDTYTTDDSNNGYRQFGGTSGATPIVAGHFGLFFQMWSEGIFGNTTLPNGTVFDNRPHATTSKAFLINTADAYDFSGANDNLTRTHQGWGMPDVERLYDLRDEFFVVDQGVPLQTLESAEFTVNVGNSTPEFRATMVYMDPMGTTSSTLHRINDLSLRVTAPSGTVYWGNNGLLTGNVSTAGGVANTVDTVENVFVANPQPGLWTVEVIATEVNEDANPGTPAMDAEFSLVVSGVETVSASLDSIAVVSGEDLSGDLESILESDDKTFDLLAVAPDAEFSPASVLLTGSLTSDSPSSFQVQLELQGNTPGLSATVELFNYENDEFTEIGSDTISFVGDGTSLFNVTENASNYAEPVTGNFRARIVFDANDLALIFPWLIQIDQIDVDAN